MPSPGSSESPLPDISSFDLQKFGLTEESEGHPIPIDEVTLRHMSLYVLRYMHAAVTFDVQGYFEVRDETENSSFISILAEKLEKAICEKELSPGFDFRFLLKHQKTIIGGWEKQVNEAIGTDWSSWDWKGKGLMGEELARIETLFKTKFQNKGKPFLLDDLSAAIADYSTNLIDIATEVTQLASGFSESKYKKSLSGEEKEKLEKEAQLLSGVIKDFPPIGGGKGLLQVLEEAFVTGTGI